MSDLRDVCRSYKGEPHQDNALSWLQEHLAPDAWEHFLEEWRKEEPKPKWPLTKEQLGEIMGCLPRYLDDGLMDDLARCCEVFEINTPVRLAYFLGQVGEESAGLRYPLEIASGAAYEWRSDLGNDHPGDGRKFKGAGFIQVTGRAHAQHFSDYMRDHGHYDAHIMEEGSRYTGNHYPWSVSGWWWQSNGMNHYCDRRPDVDRVGQRVNGVYPPRGAAERRAYTDKAFRVLGV